MFEARMSTAKCENGSFSATMHFTATARFGLIISFLRCQGYLWNIFRTSLRLYPRSLSLLAKKLRWKLNFSHVEFVRNNRTDSVATIPNSVAPG